MAAENARAVDARSAQDQAAHARKRSEDQPEHFQGLQEPGAARSIRTSIARARSPRCRIRSRSASSITIRMCPVTKSFATPGSSVRRASSRPVSKRNSTNSRFGRRTQTPMLGQAPERSGGFRLKRSRRFRHASRTSSAYRVSSHGPDAPGRVRCARPERSASRVLRRISRSHGASLRFPARADRASGDGQSGAIAFRHCSMARSRTVAADGDGGTAAASMPSGSSGKSASWSRKA